MMIDWGKLEWDWNSLLFSTQHHSTEQPKRKHELMNKKRMSHGEEWRKKWFQSLLSLVAIIVVIVYQRNTMFFVWTERSETRRLDVRSSKFIRRAESDDFQCLNWIYIFAARLSCRTQHTHAQHSDDSDDTIADIIARTPPTIVQRRKQSTPKALCFNSGSFPSSPSALPRLNIIFRVYRWWKLFAAALCQGEKSVRCEPVSTHWKKSRTSQRVVNEQQTATRQTIISWDISGGPTRSK